MSFPINRYKFYRAGNVIIAVTTYAGRTVKGYAKCSPDDEFDEEFGKRLAAARCNLKVAEKREQRAINKLKEKKERSLATLDELSNARDYREDAGAAHSEANRVLMELLSGVSGR